MLVFVIAFRNEEQRRRDFEKRREEEMRRRAEFEAAHPGFKMASYRLCSASGAYLGRAGVTGVRGRVLRRMSSSPSARGVPKDTLVSCFAPSGNSRGCILVKRHVPSRLRHVDSLGALGWAL